MTKRKIVVYLDNKFYN